MLKEMGIKAKNAAAVLAKSTDAQRIAALLRMSENLMDDTELILAANQKDLTAAAGTGMTQAMLDRLALTPKRVTAMAQALRETAALPDPLGEILWEDTRPNGLQIHRVSVPLGVIALIFEARPNVVSDAAGICLRAGNACILRGGKEALQSNLSIARSLRRALKETGLPEDCVQLVDNTSRESADALMRLSDYVDVLIPRGGQELIRRVVEHASVPVLETGEGVCHIYVDKDAEIGMAASIICNAKVSRPSVCNACECMLIHRDIAEKALPEIAKRLLEAGVVIKGDTESRAIDSRIIPASQEDWGREYLNLTIACRVVAGLDEAMNHIARFGTGHSEAIITDSADAAATFMRQVDAAALYHNASTRFTDGGEFGFGAEIGISTQKLHARGPLGIKALTSYKYIITGNGQTR
ncbi:MAG TPA: glutamate-5-semialdehyde dehydrogenase [Clostridia bacterium]|jgi:glutamate-5-semialdehyde dehydrogenase|nr:glutamate-5-semialdehyde dehydrogenase [Clostridia bacterium]HQA98379.1 glutamate-5-semialdehyde dehydrogenase [Clostridia bacterium]HQO56529.1 glutamate-5-semialdehyde dehydrogenase [Clostridia bacterium]HUM60233.1 glutamate-5-semialdehyde dehydrogenase [Clostridia bacterium]